VTAVSDGGSRPQTPGVASIPLPTRRSTVQLAKRLAGAIEGGDLVVLSGGLGAGKTFFARALCRALGVSAQVPITSPTFTLVHEYDGRVRLRHADAYRLHNAGELVELGLREQRTEGAVLVVEWGGPYVGALGGDGLLLEIAVSPTGERTARPASTGPRSLTLVRACEEPAPAPAP
jgi:tRNA threonylcarbamoyladenosine biosynthesis protein TsaE